MLKPDTLALTALLGLLTALGPMSTDMYLPSLPRIGATLGADVSAVQATLSAFLVGFAAGQIVHGPLSDRLGRKPVLIAGLALYTLASLLCAVSVSIEMLIAARFLQALGASGPIVLARSIVRDLYEGPRAGTELSRMGTIMGLVPAIAPTFGGLMDASVGWRASFVVALLFGVLGLFACTTALPETLRTRAPGALSLGGILRGFADLLRNVPFRFDVAVVAATYGGLFAFISGSSFVLQGVYGLSGPVYGFAFGTCALAYVAGTLSGRQLVRRVGMERSVSIGTLLLAGGGLAMVAGILVVPGAVAAMVGPMMIYMVGLGIVMPLTMASALMPFPDRAGAASSLMGVVQMTFGAGVGVLVGQIVGRSALPLAVVIAVLGTGALLAFRTKPRPA